MKELIGRFYNYEKAEIYIHITINESENYLKDLREKVFLNSDLAYKEFELVYDYLFYALNHCYDKQYELFKVYKDKKVVKRKTGKLGVIEDTDEIREIKRKIRFYGTKLEGLQKCELLFDNFQKLYFSDKVLPNVEEYDFSSIEWALIIYYINPPNLTKIKGKLKEVIRDFKIKHDVKNTIDSLRNSYFDVKAGKLDLKLSLKKITKIRPFIKQHYPDFDEIFKKEINYFKSEIIDNQ